MSTNGERRARVNGLPGGTISWEEHLEAWESYTWHHPGQDAETIDARGGFGAGELITQLGYFPTSWRPDSRTRFMRGVEFVATTFAPGTCKTPRCIAARNHSGGHVLAGPVQS